MQYTDNDELRQLLDANPEPQKMIAGHVEDKPTTATEMMYREREKMVAEEYRLYLRQTVIFILNAEAIWGHTCILYNP